jgi:hypothetical protein
MTYGKLLLSRLRCLKVKVIEIRDDDEEDGSSQHQEEALIDIHFCCE